ncbi:hypothetical protein [Paenibacillus lautus]|uniref:hypothetical protein n=1 Tax=Paenibacillus lautus TaxID=1401 RepID=UPI001C7DDEE8|nr:hypothetical protein [Paenibacillus lautus]MBX4152358.1 hypothetical protein [Paenibacillus lautus]
MRISEDIKIEYIDKDHNAFIDVDGELKSIGKILNHGIDWSVSVQLNEFGLKYFSFN